MGKILVCETLEQFKKDCMDYAKSIGFEPSDKDADINVNLNDWTLYANYLIEAKYGNFAWSHSDDKSPVFVYPE